MLTLSRVKSPGRSAAIADDAVPPTAKIPAVARSTTSLTAELFTFISNRILMILQLAASRCTIFFLDAVAHKDRFAVITWQLGSHARFEVTNAVQTTPCAQSIP